MNSEKEVETGEHPELELPPFNNIFLSSFCIPFLIYLILFRCASELVKQYMWKDYLGFQRYRLQNLTICLLHSCISGLWSVGFFITHPNEMFNDVIHYYNTFAAQLPILAVAYFVHDAIDMLRYEWSRWTLELLLHHTATCLALISGLLPQRFLLADYWALLMEGNRRISELSTIYPGVFRRIIALNVASFVLFRFVSQAVFVHWTIAHMHQMHLYYVGVALGGPLVFLIINVLLFSRILISDGFLGEERKRKSINRDRVPGTSENVKDRGNEMNLLRKNRDNKSA